MRRPLSIRKEVLEFVKASEMILSSVLIQPPLNQDERALIAEYVRHFSDTKQPWNEHLLQKYA
jgi:hypothetical protein